MLFGRLHQILYGKINSKLFARALAAGVFGMSCSILVSGCLPAFKPGAFGLNPFVALSAGSMEGLSKQLKELEDKPINFKKDQLEIFHSLTNDSVLKQKSAYVLGRLCAQSNDSNDLKAALAYFEEASNLKPLWKHCQWHIVECAASLGNEKAVRKALAALLERASEKDADVAKYKYALAQSYVRSSETDKAQATFLELKKLAPLCQFALGANYYLGIMALNGKDQATGIALFHNYLKSSPDGRFAQDIIQELNKLPGFVLTKNDHKLFAEVYFVQGQWANALKHWSYTQVSAGQPSDWFKQFLCLIHLGRIEESKKALLSGIKAHPKDPKIVIAANLLAKRLSKNHALALWKTVLAQSPISADVALYNLALRLPSNQGLNYYRQLASRYPTSAYAPESCWWLFWDQVTHGKFAQALPLAKFAQNRYPEAKAAARFAFWTGKIYEKLKQKTYAQQTYKKAYEAYPASYYGFRAKARLAALTSPAGDSAWRTSPSSSAYIPANIRENWCWPEPAQIIAVASLPASLKATLTCLTELRQWDECLELAPDENLLLRAAYYAQLKLPLDAINIAGSKLKGKPQLNAAWQLAYPLLYANTIEQHATAKHIDSLLVQALIREESRYNIHALSSSHALGLMQLLPGTAYGVAKRIGLRLGSKDDIYKPENNLALGIDYLAYAHSRFHGNSLLAVASYNGGPNAVKLWASRLGLSDVDAFVEKIPYTETRDYVRKVFGSYWNYQAIYGQNK